MKRRAINRGQSALDLIEEAVHLLRRAPLRLLLSYYLGAIPFVLGLLYFWADMSCGALAGQHCAVWALGVALLFLWMKFWHAVFAAGLRESIGACLPTRWGWRRSVRVLAAQGCIQPSKFFLLPLAFIATLPFAWTVAFYESATALGDGETGSARQLARRAGIQAAVRPGQNHLVLGILFLLGVAVWLNAGIAVSSTPQLLKLFLGIETAFTRGGWSSVLNTTFLATTVALAYLALDPLVKAIFVLRCFYGEARNDGADLLADLAVVGQRASRLALLAASVLLLVPFRVPADTEPARKTADPMAASPGVSPAELERAVKATLGQEKYTWRLPREKVAAIDGPVKGWLRELIDGLVETTLGWMRTLRDFAREVIHWLRDIFKTNPKAADAWQSSRLDWMLVLRGFAYVLIGLSALALALLLWRVARQGWKGRTAIVAEVLPAQPDLTDENLTASQLPEDGWLKLARELMEKGELRLAVRALYLAGLAHLAEREMISLARFKSNRDYEQEVARRGRGQPELRAAFSENVALFDRVWYGLYEVTSEALGRFQINLERIRAC